MLENGHSECTIFRDENLLMDFAVLFKAVVREMRFLAGYFNYIHKVKKEIYRENLIKSPHLTFCVDIDIDVFWY